MMESVGLHGGESWVTWWVVLGYMVGSVGYMVECVGLHDGECWVTWWRELGYMVGSVGLHGG